MSNEELQRAAEVMIAASKGEPIQMFDSIRGQWVDVPEENLFTLPWSWNRDNYRVKPLDYRPYESQEEFRTESMKHSGTVHAKGSSEDLFVTSVSSVGIRVSFFGCATGYAVSYPTLLRGYVWEDGMPCGIKLEEGKTWME